MYQFLGRLGEKPLLIRNLCGYVASFARRFRYIAFIGVLYPIGVSGSQQIKISEGITRSLVLHVPPSNTPCIVLLRDYSARQLLYFQGTIRWLKSQDMYPQDRQADRQSGGQFVSTNLQVDVVVKRNVHVYQAKTKHGTDSMYSLQYVIIYVIIQIQWEKKREAQ